MTIQRSVLREDKGHTWLELGRGEPLILVHGIGGTTNNWAPILDQLARDHKVFAWSLPGYNRAAALSKSNPSAVDFGKCLLEFIGHRGIARAHFVGHSLGAIVVAALAHIAPERAARLTLICPLIGGGHLPLREREVVRERRIIEILGMGMKAFAETRTAAIVGKTASLSDMREIIATMETVPEVAYFQAWEMLCCSNIGLLLQNSAAPALVIGGGTDPVAPPPTIVQLAKLLSLRPHILPSIGHFPMHEAGEVLVDLIRHRPT